MALSEDLTAWLRLTLTPGLEGAGLRRLLGTLGDPERVMAASRAELDHRPRPVHGRR